MDSVLSFLLHGVTHASWWQIVLFTLITTHLTIIGVTLYLHRSQTHRGVDFHPIVSHLLRFWLWLGTGMVTKEWVAIHRKHHARCEREGDPHSPIVYGIERVFFSGAELYRQEAENAETLSKFGHGTPDDWLERNVYSRHSVIGVSLLLIIDVALFGVLGLTVWAIQMAWIPFWAAGVVNGIGHYWGYRNYGSPDTSTNVFPIGIIIGGEELHNNHHAHATSARFSSKWWEFDIGWMYICILSAVGLAKVRRVAPRPQLSADKPAIDLQTLQAVLTHRYEIMGRYGHMLRQACHDEIEKLKASSVEPSQWRRLTQARRKLKRTGGEVVLAAQQSDEVDQILSQHVPLSLMVQMRNELARIWESSSSSSEKLLQELQDWCHRAQQSGNERLAEFAQRLRYYAA